MRSFGEISGGAVHDRRMYDQARALSYLRLSCTAPPDISPNERISDEEHLLADTGVIRDGGETYACPFKVGMGLEFALHGYLKQVYSSNAHSE